MRVTDMMTYSNAMASSGRARDNVDAASEETSSGLRLVHPGDDPGAAGQVVAHSLSKSRLTAIVSGATAAGDELRTADGALQTVNNAIQRAQELAVQMSNDTLNAAGRSAGAAEIGNLLQEVVSVMNTKQGNRYLFGGNLDDKPPFDPSGAYSGDAGVRRIEVAPGVTQAVSIRADIAIKGVGGGVDVLATMQKLQTALQANDTSGVQGTIDALSKSNDQVSLARTGAGVSMNALDATVAAGTIARDGETKQISHLQDADVVDSTTKLALAQHALEASLSASAQSFKFSLMDFIK